MFFQIGTFVTALILTVVFGMNSIKQASKIDIRKDKKKVEVGTRFNKKRLPTNTFTKAE